MSHAEKCSHCGTESTDQLSGICPSCLMKLGLEPDEDASFSTVSRRPDEDASSRMKHLPERIGSYQIVDVLGEGGMGIVFLADQVEPIRRRVALKVIRPDMDTREILERFALERQALAVMNHPNVAQVYEAGTTEDGRPYFAMEYVRGIRITDYCDLHCLSLRDRLQLFQGVCDGVQHAHQKGVVHRDIKPSNVIVSSESGKPVPKVIDFGLAKASGREYLSHSFRTHHGVLIGTPEYMSPEQAGIQGVTVDVRTDIYSLGVLLYELVVGALPFDPKSLRRAAVAEMLRIIQQEDPPTPTTRLSSLGPLAAEVARRRRSDVRTLIREVHGDLEWITLRAMAKEPERRYSAASELAADVARHLADEPVMAGPPSASYRLGKLFRRHRNLAASIAASILILLGGLVVSTSFWVRAEAARERAEMEATRNELDQSAIQAALLENVNEYERLSEEVVRLQRSMLGEGSEELLLYEANRHLLMELLTFARLPDAADGNPKHRRDPLIIADRALARGDSTSLRTVALIATTLPPARARTLTRKLLEAVERSEPDLDEATLEMIDHLIRREAAVGLAVQDLEHVDRRILERRQAVLPAGSPSLVEAQISLSTDLERRAQRLLFEGNDREAEPLLQEALALVRAAGAEEYGREARLSSDLGAALTGLGRFEDAERLLTYAIAVSKKERGANNADTHVAARRLERLYHVWNRSGDETRTHETLPEIFVERYRDRGEIEFGGGIVSADGGHSVQTGHQSFWFVRDAVTSRSEPSIGLLSTVVTNNNLDAVNGLRLVHPGSVDSADDLLRLTNDELSFNAAHGRPDCTEACGTRLVLQPEDVFFDKSARRLLLFYRRVVRTASGDEDIVGSSIAVCSSDLPVHCERPVVRSDSATPTVLFGPGEPPWGSAVVATNEHLYAFACTAHGLDTSCRVSRVPLGAILDRDAWTFFAGQDRWSRDWKDAVPVLGGGIQWGALSIHWNRFLERYVASWSRVLDTQITIAFANRPEGPWSEDRIGIDTLHSGPGWSWTTWGLGHPELAREGGRVEYFSYRRNVANLREVRLIEVEFGRR